MLKERAEGIAVISWVTLAKSRAACHCRSVGFPTGTAARAFSRNPSIRIGRRFRAKLRAPVTLSGALRRFAMRVLLVLGVDLLDLHLDRLTPRRPGR